MQAAAERGQLYVWIIGETDATGNSWCPDCNRARFFLAPRLAELPAAAVVIEAAVSRLEWQARDHPYRQHPFLADGVPCLLRIGDFIIQMKIIQ